ncbi:TIGR03086 family metal-binding protein [Sinosporangium siamense]|uniref:TIGR03086 family protein n=1 Tax=Sinosporangium siamense TaxID=1367973 RepID=A0A919VBH6_9ACTN|nr:TIGR03086 family metal-binding protein [Sinosporangium siamense]GII97606.1 TIGR03086 family protein [Sinosporangium siamense]
MHVHALHPLMASAAAEAARLARGVRAGQLDGPTPCTAFDTRTLVNHWVLYTSHGLERRARREPLPQELVERDFTAEPDWAEGYAKQLDRAVDAWADPAVWAGEVDLGWASMPAVTIAQMVIKEMVVHGWDVARATGQEIHVPDDLARMIFEVVEEHAESYRQYDGFAAPVRIPADAPLFDRALAASGRDPRWSPPA